MNADGNISVNIPKGQLRDDYLKIIEEVNQIGMKEGEFGRHCFRAMIKAVKREGLGAILTGGE
jgi:hypothetical protein